MNRDVTTNEHESAAASPAAAAPASGTTPQRAGAAQRPVLRFAPSPNGELHLGHALSALINWEMARRLGGRLLLRIEDIDLGRTRQQYIDQIYEDLAWLGITWETPVRRQSEHFADYAAAAAKLAAMGLLYPCFATRAEIEAAAVPGALDPDGAPLYPGLHRTLASAEIARRRAAGERPALRLHMRAAIDAARRMAHAELTFCAADFAQDAPLRTVLKPRGRTAGQGSVQREPDADGKLELTELPTHPDRWGDVVIQRKDVPTSYHLAVVVDDALQGVTHVVRGADLLAATDLHRLLQLLLGLPAPVYHHHRLLLGEDGRKLAKSRRDTSLRALRAGGCTAAGIQRMLGFAEAPDEP